MARRVKRIGFGWSEKWIEGEEDASWRDGGGGWNGGVEFVVTRFRTGKVQISSLVAEAWLSMLITAVRKRLSAPVWRCAKAKVSASSNYGRLVLGPLGGRGGGELGRVDEPGEKLVWRDLWSVS